MGKIEILVRKRPFSLNKFLVVNSMKFVGEFRGEIRTYKMSVSPNLILSDHVSAVLSGRWD